MPVQSARTSPTASDERIRNVMRREISRAISIERSTTRAQLAEDSGVNIHNIDAILSQDRAKHRRVACEDALSLAWVLGERAVNALLAVIAYSRARPTSDVEEDCPLEAGCNSMDALGRFMRAAADRRIDHLEAPDATEAVDTIIAELAPFSSAGKRS